MRRTAPAEAHPPRYARPVAPLSNLGALVRFGLRRDRVRLAAWTASMVAMIAVSAQSVIALFPTQASLDAAAAASSNPAVLAFNGPPFGLRTLGGEVAFQVGAPGLVIASLMAILIVGRASRDEEASGRLELIRAQPIGLLAPAMAAFIEQFVASIVIGAALAITLVAFGLPLAGSICFGAGYTALGSFFAAVTVLTAQLSTSGRLAKGLAGAALGTAFGLRAIGDLGENRIAWLSPIGWVQRARPFAGERWWPLVLTFAAAAVVMAAALRLVSRRDLGSGILGARPGPAHARARLRTPLALASRLQMGAWWSWTIGLAITGATFGLLTDVMNQFVEDNPQLADAMSVPGAGTITDGYLAYSARLLAMIAAGFAVQSGLWLRGEETSGRLELLLAVDGSRRRVWNASGAITIGGTMAMLAVGGTAIGLSAGTSLTDPALGLELVLATVIYAPAVWLFTALAWWLQAERPRWASGSWAALAIATVLSLFGPLMGLPGWVQRLSPFNDVPALPADRSGWIYVVAFAAATALSAFAASGRFDERDIGT